MKKLRHLCLLATGIAAGALFATGCLKDPNGGGKRPDKGEEAFDYATTANVKLQIDYALPGTKAAFELFDEIPVTIEHGVATKKQGVKALLKAYTDADSKYEGVVNLPAGAEKVYLYSESYALPTCLAAEVTEGGIVFDLAALRDKFAAGAEKSSHGTRAYTAENPYNIQYLGDWDNRGLPNYIKRKKEDPYYYPIPDYATVPPGLMNRLQYKLLPGSDNRDLTRPTEVMNLNVREDAHLTLVFAGEWGAYHNAIGYYFYPTGNPPKTAAEMEALPKYVAFPNASSWTTSFTGDELIDMNSPSLDIASPLWVGEQVVLQYVHNGKTTDLFPAGTTVGWFLLPDGFETESFSALGYLNITGSKHPIRYSNNEFNEGGEKYMVSLYDKASGKTILGFEDSDDFDLKDVLFFVDADPAGAIVDPDRPEIEDPDNPHPDITGDPIEGTLAFEDLWPSQGDYDMNDAVIRYSTTFVTDKDNFILRIEDVFTPLHVGGQIPCAFGYELDLPAVNIRDVRIENGSSSATVAGGLETGQQKPVVMLFDDLKEAIARGPIRVTTTLDGNVHLAKVTRKTLYNPFICVGSKGFEAGALRKEIHLTNYAPTSLADPYPFGRNDDKSSVDKDGKPVGPYYYVTSDLHPFAIDLPTIDYRIPSEMTEIDVYYPYFADWVRSNGEKHKDWYEKPAK